MALLENGALSDERSRLILALVDGELGTSMRALLRGLGSVYASWPALYDLL